MSAEKQQGFGFKFPSFSKTLAEKLWTQYIKISKRPEAATEADMKLLKQYQKKYQTEMENIGKDVSWEMKEALNYGKKKEPKIEEPTPDYEEKLARFSVDLRDEAKGLRKYDDPPHVERRLRFHSFHK